MWVGVIGGACVVGLAGLVGVVGVVGVVCVVGVVSNFICDCGIYSKLKVLSF